MKKSIFAVFLIVAVCVGGVLAQTTRRVVRKATTTRTTVKKPVVKKTPVKAVVKQEGVTTASGLTYIITKKGDGAPIKKGDQVIVNYTGLLTNGKKFDSSFDRNQPFSFFVGEGRVIRGWDEGLQLLRVGDHATLIIPSSIGYGELGAGAIIPGGATLIFIIEVIGVK
jgi:FKBP-type peptidyl-prolyl cis-trans isomerase